MDDLIRAAISKHTLDAYMNIMISTDGAPEALKLYEKALEVSCTLGNPTEEDFAERRGIYRYLGFCTYLTMPDDADIAMLQRAYDYYAKGTPFSDEVNEKVVAAYVMVMAGLYKCDRAAYGKDCREVLEQIHRDYFKKFSDIDYKYGLLCQLIHCKCDPLCGTPDYYEAENLSKNFLMWAEKKRSGSTEPEIANADATETELRDMYAELSRLIESKRRNEAAPASAVASTSTTNSDNPWYKEYFPLSKSILGGGELFGKCLIYVAASILCTILAEGLGVLVGIYSLVGIVIAILDFACVI